jgi:hypothetical protein
MMTLLNNLTLHKNNPPQRQRWKNVCNLFAIIVKFDSEFVSFFLDSGEFLKENGELEVALMQWLTLKVFHHRVILIVVNRLRVVCSVRPTRLQFYQQRPKRLLKRVGR